MFKSIIAFCSVLVFFVACKPSEQSKEAAVGKLGSITIVANKDIQKHLKSNLDSTFLKDFVHYTGGEPFSEILRPDPEEFYKFFYNQKSIFVLVTKSTLSELEDVLVPFTDKEIEQYINNPLPELVSKSDVFAKFQHIVYLFGKDATDLKAKLAKCETQLTKMMLDFEVKDQHDMLFSASNPNDSYVNLMKKELGMSIRIPNGFKLKEHANGFWWFEENIAGANKIMAIIVHGYPSNDSSDYTYSSIVAHRDSVIKYHIKGELKGTFMSTSESEQYPQRFVDKLTIGNSSGAKVRGWWNFDGMMMSGPFLRYIVKVPNSNSVFAFEGFSYSDNLDFKDKDLRLIESIALSIK